MNTLPDSVRETVKVWARLALTGRESELRRAISAAEAANTQEWQLIVVYMTSPRETAESLEIDIIRAEVRAELNKDPT